MTPKIVLLIEWYPLSKTAQDQCGRVDVACLTVKIGLVGQVEYMKKNLNKNILDLEILIGKIPLNYVNSTTLNKV